MSNLEDVIRDFINDNRELFEYFWKRDDSPTDEEWDSVAETWYDEYEEVADWQEVEDKVMRQVEQYNWSNHVSAVANDALYVESDILFDAGREDRLFGGN
jgi:hypothetical protein